MSTTPPNDDGIPTFDEVREKIERRRDRDRLRRDGRRVSRGSDRPRAVRRSQRGRAQEARRDPQVDGRVTSDLDELVTRLRAAGCVFAEEEAQILRRHAADDEELARWADRRVAGEPLEHVVGVVEFAGLELSVGPGVSSRGNARN